MKIYTKTGDKGKTSLLSGEKVKKHNIRLNAYGSVDELNSFIGYLISLNINKKHKEFLTDVQHKLFNLGALLAVKKDVNFKIPEITDKDIQALETEIDRLNKGIPPLKEFILPGGSAETAQCHICRSVCRRAERTVSELSEKEKIQELLLIYLNRLSDYFFVLARKISQEKEIKETVWKP